MGAPVGPPLRELVLGDAPEAWERLGFAPGAPIGGVRVELTGAVQPGRRIATVSRDAGLGVALALMTPRRT